MTFPFVISLPHCSGLIPDEMRTALALSDAEVKESADTGTKEIFGSLPAKIVIEAEYSRLLVDLNRDFLQKGNKGVVAQVDYHGRHIYNPGCVPSEIEVTKRLKRYYFPFHKRLNKALDMPDIKGLFDCHSLDGVGPAEAPDPGEKRKDIILGNNGDNNGNPLPVLGDTTCPLEILNLVKEAFEQSGFSVSINHPYAGGFITTCYGQRLVREGKFALQIEINQDLYMIPSGKRPDPGKLEETRRIILQLFQQIAKEL